jgi:hypothetical protein
MSNLELSTLNIKNENEVVQYERALFRAFSSTDIITLDAIWDFDIPRERYRPKIPYQSQEIYIAKLRGEIVAGAAMNFYVEEELQLEMIGFSIDKTEKHICEGIGIFNLQIFGGMNVIALQLRDYSYDRLREKNIERIYGTCSEKRLRGYQLLGFQAIDELVFKGEKKYLLVTEL